MWEVFVAAAIWVGTHLGLSSTSVRQLLVQRLGAQGFLVVYSLIAAASLAYLIWIYTDVHRFDYAWLPNPDVYWVAKVSMPIALILTLGGFMVRNPTMVGATLENPSQARDMATGVTRITRHPFQWAVVIWGLSHIVANGDWVSIIFFASFVVLSAAGTVLMDIKKAATMGEAWQAYAGVTSNFPFAAIVAGRNRLVLRELLLPVLAGLVAYALLYYFHESFTGTVVI